MNMKVLLRKNGPLLFTIGAGIGLVAAVVTAWEAGGEAAFDYQITKENIEAIKFEAEEKKSRVEGTEDADLLEKDAETAIHEQKFAFCGAMLKGALLPLGLTAASLFCLINAQKMNAKHIAAIGAGYAALKSHGDVIKKKAKEFIGEYKEDEFREEIAQDWIDRSPVTPNGAFEDTGKGNELFFDPLCNRYFMSSKEDVEEAIRLAKADMAKIRKKDNKWNWMTLNDWHFNYLGIDESELGNWVRFNPEVFDVTLERAQTLDHAVSPYTFVLTYNDVPELIA